VTEPRTWTSQYTVNAAPAGQPQYRYLYNVEVQQSYQIDGTELWAVRWMSRCLSRDGEWTLEPIPSSRTDEFLAAHRFDLDTALRLAKEAAPKITVNGRRPDGTPE
jgi:hypothetical protein